MWSSLKFEDLERFGKANNFTSVVYQHRFDADPDPDPTKFTHVGK
jgi:hypothetical protein